jgi:hypothetical protein
MNTLELRTFLTLTLAFHPSEGLPTMQIPDSHSKTEMPPVVQLMSRVPDDMPSGGEYVMEKDERGEIRRILTPKTIEKGINKGKTNGWKQYEEVDA